MDFMSYNNYKYVSNGCPNQLQLKFLIEISLTFEVKRRYIQVDSFGFSQQVPESDEAKYEKNRVNIVAKQFRFPFNLTNFLKLKFKL